MATATLARQSTKDETAILAVIDTIHQAHHNKDAAGIIAPYAPNADIYDLSPPLVHHGMSLTEKQAWLDTWIGPIERESRDLRVTVSGDSAFCHGYFRLAGIPKMAGREISFWMRATVCLERKADQWRIIHEHTSVPFYMDGSLRPAFDLTPESA